ncbi:spatacsin-like [Diadema setosum]|uniref:spatacsin-like n=1 Tax=Diadema setosum TaxID=31175 RepID=UPI003B39FF36
MAASHIRNSVCVRKLRTGFHLSSCAEFSFHAKSGSIIICNNGESPSSWQKHKADGVIALDEVVPNATSLHHCQPSISETQKDIILVTGRDQSLTVVNLHFKHTHDKGAVSNDYAKVEALCVCTKERLLKAVGGSAIPKVHILVVEQTSASLLVGTHFCQLEFDSAKPASCSISRRFTLSWVDSGVTEEVVQQARLKGRLLFVLHPSGNFSIFSVTSQKLVAHINHNDFIHSMFSNVGILESQDVGKPSHFDVSQDLQDVIVAYTDAKYGLYRINLVEYFSHNPRHVLSGGTGTGVGPGRRTQRLDKDEDELDFSQGASPVGKKGASGNRSWWNYVDSLTKELSSRDSQTLKAHRQESCSDAGRWQNWHQIVEGHYHAGNQRDGKMVRRGKVAQARHVTRFQRKHGRPASDATSVKATSQRSETAGRGADQPLSTAIRAAKVSKRLPVREVHASHSSIVVCYGSPPQDPESSCYGGLCYLDLDSNASLFHSFLEPTLVSLSGDLTQPHVLLTRSEVRLLSMGMEQESLVNRMMVYKSATVTEALCHLNNWDHCAIPIHALEIGLKHRQLDTIAFFLKSGENLFRSKQVDAKGVASLMPLGGPTLTTPPASPVSSSNEEMQLWLAMDLLSQAIASNIRETKSKQYALQLLHLTLKHLNKLIHNATDALQLLSSSDAHQAASSSSPSASAQASVAGASSPLLSPNGISPSSSTSSPGADGAATAMHMVVAEGFEGSRADLEKTVKKLMDYTFQLRGYLKGSPDWMLTSHDSPDGGDDTDAARHPAPKMMYGRKETTTLTDLHAWDSLSPQEIIQSAITTRQIPLAQAYLREQQGVPGLVGSLQTTGLPLLIETGLMQAYSFLLFGEMEKACTMLQNMGYNVSEEVKKICLFTANTGLRDFLIGELRESHDFSAEEAEMIHFTHQLEHLYTCQSFEKAKALAVEKSRSFSSSESWLPPPDAEAKAFLDRVMRRGDILVSSEPTNCENFHYSHVVLDWVRSWSPETRDRILLERLLASRSKDTSISYSSLSAHSAWSYLTAHHQWDQLQLWIRSSFGPSPDGSSSSSRDLSPWLQQLSLLPGVAHEMDSCSQYLREKILDQLSRNGIFSSAELASFDLLTRRLSSTQQLFQRPHPLGQRADTASVIPAFKQWFLDMCIRKKLPGMLHAFLDFYSLCLSENEVMSLQLPLASCPWLEILLHFRWIGRQVTDPSLVFQASLSNARLFLKVMQPTVSALMEGGHPIVAMATLLYAPGSIPQALTPATSEEQQLWKVSAERLKLVLRPYPKLLAAIFPPPRVGGVKPQDISVYQLLQGNAPLDPRKLFLWQSTNNVASIEDTASEMPYFSDPRLIQRYAYTEAFSFTYYLKQGRPSFAYITFITSLLQAGEEVTKTTLFRVYVKAYITALHNFANDGICAACVAFIEMLGRDSLSLRTDVQTAKTIADHLWSRSADSGGDVSSGSVGQLSASYVERSLKEKRDAVDRYVVNLMMSCVKGSDLCTQSVLQKLEDAISSRVDQLKIERVSWSAAEEWNLAVMFCRLHGVAMTTAFLRECTRANSWLHFICFVQTHQYPKHQVLDLVKSFQSDTIREHLSHALSHLIYGPAPFQDGEASASSPGGPGGPKSKMPVKDYRSAYYTKMGFLQSMSGAATETSDDADESSGDPDRRKPASVEEQTVTEDDALDDLEVSDLSQELFEIVFQCGKHPKPWRAFLIHAVLLEQPVLAVIAACHQGANILDCLCSWLYAALADDPSVEKFMGSASIVKSHSWSLDELQSLADTAIESGRITLLTKAFHIFDKKGTLNPFLDFCENFLVHRDRNQCKIDLEFFHEAILACRRRSSMRNQPDLGTHRPRLGHLEWFQESANHIARNILLSCGSQWEIGFLLEILAEANFSRTVGIDVPDYSRLHGLKKALSGSGLELNLKKMLASDGSGDAFDEECHSLLAKLEGLKKFDQAREFALVAGLSTDSVVIQHVLSDLSQFLNSEAGSTDAGRIAFWIKSNETLMKVKLEPQTAAEFYKTQVCETKLTGEKPAREKAFLLGLAHHWLSHHRSGASQDMRQSVEQEVWQWRLYAEVDKARQQEERCTSLDLSGGHSSASDWIPKSRGATELLYSVESLPTETWATCSLKTQEEESALNGMIDSLLQQCCLAQAHRLAAQFGHTYRDLLIALTCLQLMQGMVTPEGIDPSLQPLVKRRTSQPKLARRPSNLALLGPPTGVYGGRRKGLKRTPSVASLGINQELSAPGPDERLAAMEALADHTLAARSCCDRITNIYRISQVLGKPYDSLIRQVPFTTVKSLLQSSHPDCYLLTKDFIRANQLADSEVANFLVDVVMTTLQQKLKRRNSNLIRTASAAASDTPSPERVDKVTFMNLAKLCKDPANLGTRLLDEATQISRSDLSTSRPALSLEVELIIRAHDCFTLSCNMEGISSVLRACSDCVTALTQTEEYSLMVRLMMGVRRYNEMTYLFEILRANHQIEALLKKGAGDDKLKVALLDYLKRCDPPDTETYGLVALKCGMYREVASLLEQDAVQRIKSLESRSMDSNIEIQNILENILQDLTNAAKNFAQDNCLRHAERCVKKARLIALQIHLLPLRSKVINIDPKDVPKFVSQHPKFHEALIIQDAYPKQSEWSAALYHNVVLQGNFRYLEDFRASIQLTANHFTEVASRYRQESNKTSLMASHMQRFLGHCPDVLTTYRIANQLEFKDMALNLLKGDAGAYLTDVA